MCAHYTHVCVYALTLTRAQHGSITCVNTCTWICTANALRTYAPGLAAVTLARPRTKQGEAQCDRPHVAGHVSGQRLHAALHVCGRRRERYCGTTAACARVRRHVCVKSHVCVRCHVCVRVRQIVATLQRAAKLPQQHGEARHSQLLLLPGNAGPSARLRVLDLMRVRHYMIRILMSPAQTLDASENAPRVYGQVSKPCM